jgi:hypothetical protein
MASSRLSQLQLLQSTLLSAMKSLLENFSIQFMDQTCSFCGYSYYGRESHAPGKKRPGGGPPGRVNLLFLTNGTDLRRRCTLVGSFNKLNLLS